MKSMISILTTLATMGMETPQMSEYQEPKESK